MRTLLGVGAAVVLAAAAGGQDKKAEKLDGTYLIVGGEVGGRALPAELIAEQPEEARTVTFKGDTMTLSEDGKSRVTTIKLDPSKTPARVVLTGKTPDGKDEVNYGILKLEGDTLTLCATTSGNEADRPTEFKTAPKSGTALLVMKRKDK